MRASHIGEGSRAGVVIGEQAQTSHTGEGCTAGVVIGEQARTGVGSGAEGYGRE